MRTAVKIGAAGLAVLAAAACGSSGGAAGVGGTPTSPPSELRGAPLPAVSCQPSSTARTTQPVASASVTSLIVCPLRTPNAGSRRVTLHPGSAIFDRLLTALAKPNAPATHEMCPLYADVQQTVLATTSDDAVYSLAIPVDGCGHYLPAALAALNQARGTVTPQPATSATP